jgi:hypothetical protein
MESEIKKPAPAATGTGPGKKFKADKSIAPPSPDLEQAARFLGLLAEEAESFTFQTFTDGKSRPSPDPRALVIHGALDDARVRNRLIKLSSEGAGVFVTVQETDGKGRSLSNITAVRCVFQEADRPDTPVPTLQPHLVVESSPGKFHRYWLTERSTDIELFNRVQARLVADWGSDPNAKDVARVLRVPGFPHQKDPRQPFRVRIVHESGERPYTWGEITQAFPPLEIDFGAGAPFPAGTGIANEMEVRSALAALSPDLPYAEWLTVGMVLHHVTEGGALGFELWDGWSQGGATYRHGETAYKWRSFGKHRGKPISLKAVFKMAGAVGWKWTRPKEKPTREAAAEDADQGVVIESPKSRRNGTPVLTKYVTDEAGRICLVTPDGEKPLCNFDAWIVEEALHDDGEATDTHFVIEGKLASGRPLPRIEIAASAFAGLAWVTSHWGCGAVVSAGTSNKDHLRAAIQMKSESAKRRVIYGHTGWREIDGAWRYLHGGGALGADGNRTDIEVNPGRGNMERYRLPDPPEGDALRQAVKASLTLVELAPDKPETGVALLAAVYRAPLAEVAAIDHALFVYGSTGVFKSEWAALGLAHFGETFSSRSIPANWHDSEADVEAKAHTAKDALIVIDDFKPVGGLSEINRFHSKADRLFRGVGNQSGRGRRTANLQQRAAYHPRGMVLATGEDLPKGQSLRARLTVVENGKGDIDRARLTEAQKAAREGRLAQAMAGYVRWLAPQLTELRAAFPAYMTELREKALAAGFAGGHARTPNDYASLMAGFGLFIEFAKDIGAMTDAEGCALDTLAEQALRRLMGQQGDHQADQDEVKRFFALLSSALLSGRCHLSDYINQGAPSEHPHAWGWRIVPAETPEAGRIEKPMGERIGWIDPHGCLYLEGESSLAVAQTLARAQGSELVISKTTLWKRIHERGLLLEIEKEGQRLRLSVQRNIAGEKHRVYRLSKAVFESEQP